jgi:hypothetical protein
MPLQNRVDPFGEFIASPARGLQMGNRGGRLHNANRTLGARRWASRQWICCRLQFKDRHRAVWSDGYTELFFLDEVTALSAGHRPCYECRRADALALAICWQRAFKLIKQPRAAEMDEVLHGERLAGRTKRVHQRRIDDLPDGTFVALGEGAYALRGQSMLRWSPSGYARPQRRPRDANVDVLTPPAILAALAAGYLPRWHASAQI